MSFFFRVISAVIIICVIALFTLEPSRRYDVLFGAAGLLVLLTIIVALFAWLSPKNLVYGEAGHRAEMKMAFGTEKQTFSAAEVSGMSGTQNQQQTLPSAEDNR